MAEDAHRRKYLEAVQTIGKCVAQKVLYPDSNSCIFDIHMQIATDESVGVGSERKKLISLCVKNSDLVLDRARETRVVVGDNSIFSSPEATDETLEECAGNWLALYFLGVPFVHLWEPVAFFSEGSGFPRGASLCKAVGDVYRNARKLYASASWSKREDPLPIYVLDHNPLAMRTIHNNGERDPTLRNSIALLGMLYELLQLRLYLQAGGPICFYVPRSSLKEVLSSDALSTATGRASLDDDINYMYDALTKSFQKKFAKKQLVQIADDDDLGHLPGCVLTPTQGIFRARDYSPGPGTLARANPSRASNYLASRVRNDLLKKLQNVSPPSMTLQAFTPELFKKTCHEVVGLVS